MRKKYRFIALAVVVLAFLAVSGTYLARTNIPVLEPKGPIGLKERNLMFFALGLALIVVIPVFTLLFVFAYRYREGNPKKTKYSPDFDHSRILETIWWLIPGVLITILSVVTWNSSHELNPYKPIASKTPTMTIDVVSLDWKWLFIYPKQNIATVNFAQIPVNTPVDFQLTSNSVMNSFWVPQLGGQIYCMPGMVTQLNLMATSDGSFHGSSANISGNGFAGMTFQVKSSSNAQFNSWVANVRATKRPLSTTLYTELAAPSEYNPISYYAPVTPHLFGEIVMKYMAPASKSSSNTNGNSNSSQSMTMQMQGMGM